MAQLNAPIRPLKHPISQWVEQFDCTHIKPLIICRGPIRFETMQIFSSMGIEHYGILISNKDSITYPNALAPELRIIKDYNRIHHITDYSGTTRQERLKRIDEIIEIAQHNGYNAIFAGYGFMAEDETMVAAMEDAGLTFIGPCSTTVRRAGLKDEAKKTALKSNVSVIAGISEATNLANVESQVAALMSEYPNYRIRLKATNGGGGKGQRILDNAADAVTLGREILAEMQCADDDKVILIELNIETTRHQEIQVIGNGNWCMTLGGRDCSLQMHEQKLLEVSVTVEGLQQALEQAKMDSATDNSAKVAQQSLQTDLDILLKMELEAERFGLATGLNSVSTFECIVDDNNHFFMEMNTRIQVEHRVSELCYSLRFTNPDDSGDGFEVDSLVALMVLLAAHGESLPKPQRIRRFNSAVEARLNATNHALQPHAGGTIEYWSKAIAGEIRDDQGISLPNPDTNAFVEYHLAGAYDSNIALLLATGNRRIDSYRNLADIVRQCNIRGRDLATNLDFQYGLINWFIGNNINAKATTAFIQPYLTLVGKLFQLAQQIDLDYIWQQLLTDARVANRQQNLMLRPLRLLLANPHLLAGWLSLNRSNYNSERPKLAANQLTELYHYLDMDFREGRPAANMIWREDYELLTSMKAKKNIDILGILPWLAQRADFYSLTVNDNLSIGIPNSLKDSGVQQLMSAVLAPPPVASSNEILAASGGMYYSRPAPDSEAFVEVGKHFEKGQSLYIIEVMKMFNTVKAPFAGVITGIRIDNDGTIINKGDVLLDVEPDEPISRPDSAAIAHQKRQFTQRFINAII